MMCDQSSRVPSKRPGRWASLLGRDDIDGQEGPLPLPERKVPYVRELFTRIARRYDLMNRVMTLGRDKAWRRSTVAAAVPTRVGSPKDRRGRVLDVATGTGDLVFETLRQQPGIQVTGLDLVPEMLALARQKEAQRARHSPAILSNGAPAWIVGDALHLPFPAGCFDAVVTGFALRNVADIPAALAEMARVTHGGGRMACLEIAKPRLFLFRHLFGFYFYRVVPLLGALLTGERLAYTYLPHSLTRFLTPDQIVEAMRDAGWYEIELRRLMLGTVALHMGRKPWD